MTLLHTGRVRRPSDVAPLKKFVYWHKKDLIMTTLGQSWNDLLSIEELKKNEVN